MGKHDGSKHQNDKEQKRVPLGQDELMEDELDDIAGGVYEIKTCKNCHRVAVSGMDICAVCYRKQSDQ
ncbi:MAG TPA: hypothetical protein VFT51_08735 [Bacillales bacterium]|nr:hypothetical protein [Bacillales bacterium]